MKKIVSLITAAAVSVSLCGCVFDKYFGIDETELEASASTASVVSHTTKRYDIALITDSLGIKDSNTATVWRSIVSYGDTHTKTYKYYTAENIENDAEKAVIQAIDNKAKIIVLPGAEYKRTVMSVQADYPEISFILVNTYPDSKLKDNVHCISYKEEQAGYIAGYLAISEGYTMLGFIGNSDDSANKLYANGFITGADAACEAFHVNDVTIKYSFLPKKTQNNEQTETSDEVDNIAIAQNVADRLYKRGIEAIFVCDPDTAKAVDVSAKNAGAKMICGGAVYDKYDTSLTSVCFDNVEAVDRIIKTCFDDSLKWSVSEGNTNIRLGAQDSCIDVLTEENDWKFTSVDKEAAEQLLNDLGSGAVKLSDSADKVPVTKKAVYSYYEP
ncbi:MAG: BMP family ABC transporter substrate-binding protein [Acutalibacteraceae bacterium]|nr:BMP family ABC transporter substrate-binding protein [Acutalibacteraceae bacterium]